MTTAVVAPTYTSTSSGIVTSSGPWWNPPRFTATHMRQTIIQTWLCTRHPKAWREPSTDRKHVQRLSVRGSKIYYLKYPVTAFRNGWILLNSNPKVRGTVRSVVRNLLWISSEGAFPCVLVSNLNARPATHRQEFIDQVHALGWKLVRKQKLVYKLPSRLHYDLGTQPESLEHFDVWWKQVELFCRDFELPPPELDPQLRDRFVAFRVAQHLDPVEDSFIF